MKKIFAILIIITAGYFLLQGCAKQIMDHVTFQVTPSNFLPTSAELRYQEITITHKERRIRVWLINSLIKSNNYTAILLFNGIGDNRSDWLYFQKALADSGISSVSFDYGPLEDTLKEEGTSRLDEVTEDVNSIIDTLKSICGKRLNLFLLAHSVGNAVMLEMYPDIDTTLIKGIIICNAFASMKRWSIDHGKIPRYIGFLFPDYFDNVTNIANVTQPVLIVHSRADKVNSFSDAEEIYSAAKSDKQFIQFDNYKHNDIYKKDNYNYWQPIIRFIKTHSIN